MEFWASYTGKSVRSLTFIFTYTKQGGSGNVCWFLFHLKDINYRIIFEMDINTIHSLTEKLRKQFIQSFRPIYYRAG